MYDFSMILSASSRASSAGTVHPEEAAIDLDASGRIVFIGYCEGKQCGFMSEIQNIKHRKRALPEPLQH